MPGKLDLLQGTLEVLMLKAVSLGFSALIRVFRSSIARPTGLRFNQHLAVLAARLWAKMDSLSPFL
jgi:hypothetical protein